MNVPDNIYKSNLIVNLRAKLYQAHSSEWVFSFQVFFYTHKEKRL